MLGFRIVETMLGLKVNDEFVVENENTRLVCILKDDRILVKKDNAFVKDEEDKVLNAIINGKLKVVK